MDPLFVQAFVYLTAALLVVPLAKRLGLGSVLGYLLAGLLIGPWGLQLVGDEGEDVMHFAELGVVMMLFLVGLELDPTTLWRLRGPMLGLGGLQVAVTTGVVALVGTALGLPWQQAVALGLIISMSSTAIALQILIEKGLMRSDAGQKAFAVLLFQDIAVIPMLAAFPLLATSAPVQTGVAEGHAGGSFVGHLSGWQHGAVVLGAVSAVVLAGRFLVRPAMRIIARTGLREMFTAAALVLVVGVTLLMSLVGLSPALGTFLAGVVLANSEYRHELVSDIEPFKGLLLGLFFIAVGASIDFGLLIDSPGRILGALFSIIVVKIGVLVVLGRAFGASRDQTAVFVVCLSQIGEFAFVLLAFAGQIGVLPAEIIRPMVAVTALSMAATPLLVVLNERLFLPRLAPAEVATRESDVEDEHNPVIIAGYGRFGQIAGRFLSGNGVGATAVDVDSEMMEVLASFGQKVFYGDASRLDLLRAAGAGSAKILIVAVDQQAKVMEIVHTARKHFPHLTILARARGRTEAYELLEAGVHEVYRETFGTSLRLGADALRVLGAPAHLVHRSARTFRRHDEQSVHELAVFRHDQARLVKTTRERTAALAAALAADRADFKGLDDETSE